MSRRMLLSIETGEEIRLQLICCQISSRKKYAFRKSGTKFFGEKILSSANNVFSAQVTTSRTLRTAKMKTRTRQLIYCEISIRTAGLRCRNQIIMEKHRSKDRHHLLVSHPTVKWCRQRRPVTARRRLRRTAPKSFSLTGKRMFALLRHHLIVVKQSMMKRRLLIFHLREALRCQVFTRT